MNARIQTLLLIIFILVSVALTRPYSAARFFSSDSKREEPVVIDRGVSAVSQSQFQFQRATLETNVKVKHTPLRNWNILDPSFDGEAVLVHSLDDNFPLLRKNIEHAWPIASLTKLLTAIVISEEVGLNKKIPVSESAIATFGESGNLRVREVYTAQDLVKIMLLTSSNDAAAVLEEYVGGKNVLIKMMNEKARSLEMFNTIFYDASGLSPQNVSTASDLLRLFEYSVEYHPEILATTRITQFLVQPINDITNRTEYNINPFIIHDNFLGGKTGTSPEARENLIGLFSFHTKRIAVILLGSGDRVATTERLLDWVRRAYTF